MIITFQNENYEFNDGVCKAYEEAMLVPMSGTDIPAYLSVYTRQDYEVALRTLSKDDIVYIVTKCIKDEIIALHGREIWDKYVKE